jgi:predicted Rossmann fold nucleotide-binding protein DprA/Smf involved in DNA uptake
MALTYRRIGVVGSRAFKNYAQLKRVVTGYIISDDDEIVSGGAIGADSMAQRFAKEEQYNMVIKYPQYRVYGSPATFVRNKLIVENSDVVLAFYAKGSFQQGGTANSAEWARKLGKELHEYEEE